MRTSKSTCAANITYYYYSISIWIIATKHLVHFYHKNSLSGHVSLRIRVYVRVCVIPKLFSAFLFFKSFFWISAVPRKTGLYAEHGGNYALCLNRRHTPCPYAHIGIYTPEHTYLTYTYTHCLTNVLKTPCIDSINNFFELFIYLTCAIQFECAELFLMCNHHSLITRDTFVSFCCTQTRSVTKGSQRLNWTKTASHQRYCLAPYVCSLNFVLLCSETGMPDSHQPAILPTRRSIVGLFCLECSLSCFRFSWYALS